MIIELPREFCMEGPNCKKSAFVDNGILKIRWDVSFRKAMTELTYQMKGRGRCCYCKELIPEDEITIDHMYPQEFGGPTITNNMLPSCKKCNNEKGNLNTSQYKAYLKAKKLGRVEGFRKEIKKYQDYTRQFNDFNIPIEWLTEKRIYQLIVVFNMQENYKGKNKQLNQRKTKKEHQKQKIDTVFLTAFVYNELIKQERKP